MPSSQSPAPLFNVAFIASLSFSPLAFAETIESVEYKYYEISPRTTYEIKSELRRRSPIHDAGGTFNGHTDWYINWQFQTARVQIAPEQYGCQLQNIKTKVHVVHILPALSRYVTDQKTINIFKKFNAALTQHELNHGNNGITAAREIDKNFHSLEPQQNCYSLSRYADNLGNDIVKYFVDKDSEYDRQTRNGETEGAVIY